MFHHVARLIKRLHECIRHVEKVRKTYVSGYYCVYLGMEISMHFKWSWVKRWRFMGAFQFYYTCSWSSGWQYSCNGVDFHRKTCGRGRCSHLLLKPEKFLVVWYHLFRQNCSTLPLDGNTAKYCFLFKIVFFMYNRTPNHGLLGSNHVELLYLLHFSKILPDKYKKFWIIELKTFTVLYMQFSQKPEKISTFCIRAFL